MSHVMMNKDTTNTGSPPANKASESSNKQMNLTTNIYTISYFAFMRNIKEEFKLKSTDQIEILHKAIFMFLV